MTTNDNAGAFPPRNYDDAVQRSVRALDAHGPSDWRRRVEPGQVDVVDGTHCVLGQVFGGYWSDEARAFRHAANLYGSLDWVLAHAFEALAGERDDVNAAWRRALGER